MASKSLGTLTIDLIARTGGFVQGMDRAERAANRKSKEIEQRLQRVDKAFDKIRIAVATTGVAIAGAAGAWVNSITKSMDATLKMARQIGTTTEALTGLRYAAQQFANVTDQTFDMSLRRMTRRIAEAAEGSGAAKNAIEALGLSASELAGLSVDEQFLRVADAMKGVTDQGSKLRATMAIFDTEGVPLVTALSQGSDELRKYTEEARRLGIVISTDAAIAAEKFQTSLTRMTASLRGVSISIGNQVIPVFSEFIESAFDASDEIDGVLGSARGLAADKSIHGWIDSVGIGLARLADVAVALGKTIGAVSSSFGAVFADVNLASQRYGLGMDETWITSRLFPGDIDENNSHLSDALDERNRLVEEANKKWSDLWSYQGNRYEQIWIDSRDRINHDRNFIGPPRPGGTLPPIGVSPGGNRVGGRSSQVSELQRLIQQLDQQHAVLGMTEAAAGRYRIEIAKGAETDRARALAIYDQIEAWKEADKAIKQAAESSRYIAAINRELEVFQQQQGVEIAGIGMGDRQREQLERELAIRQEYAARRRQLEEAQQIESTKLEKDQYEARISALEDAENRKIGIVRDAAAKKLEAEGSWLNGAVRGMQNYADQVANVSDSMANAVGSAFKGMESAIVEFVRTGKADFKSLADSILTEMARIAVQQAIMKPFTGWIGGMFSANALGGVYDSPSLSQYSNQVHSSPKLFAFASGAGVFAEAGPEAIMPLSRGRDGRLGVAADVSGVQGRGDINITVNVSDSGSSVTQQGGQEEFGRRLADSIRRTVREEMVREQMQGGVLWSGGIG